MRAAKSFFYLAIANSFNPDLVNGHGYLKTPRSRNVYANHRASECSQSNTGPGCPVPEYCPHCLNTNTGVCGKFGSNNYETSTWVDKGSALMPFEPQEVYVEGDVIRVKSYLDTHHNGHMELKACNKGPSVCTQEDFDAPGNELIFVKDTVFEQNHVEMPADPNYPGRGYYAGGQGGGTKSFEFMYQLPSGLYGDEVLFQWKYITANSCTPPGYNSYFTSNSLPDSYRTIGLSDCVLPYTSDGSRTTTSPEQFWNCAEVKILPAGSRSPTVSPKPSASPTTSVPTAPQPTASPVTCIAEWQVCSNINESCCDGFRCTQVDPTGTSLCLTDTCPNAPTPHSTPTNPPYTASPNTPSPTSPPNTASPNVNDGCCTIDLKTCYHIPGSYCASSKENCEGNCGKLWLENGELDGCKALWQACATSDECCQHAICENALCSSSDPYLKGSSSPTAKQTPVPTTKPTILAPTTSVPPTTITSPTAPPTTAAPATFAPHGSSFPAQESGFVRVNQIGYLKFATKVGVVVDASESPLKWQIQDSSGSVLLGGLTTVYGDDGASEDHIHHADFSSLREIGSYRLVVEGVGASLMFNVAPTLYPKLPLEAMNYFYFHRMGQEIAGEHLVDSRYARSSLHTGDSSLPPHKGWCEGCTNFDLRGSWADAGDFGVYTVNHAISAWTLLNLHELFPDAFGDGSLNIDESGNSFPDVLDEVDYGSRFVRGMLPSDGGLASHKAHNHIWSAFPTTIEDENNQQRSVMGSSTPATYAVARVNAHLARLWKSRGGNNDYISLLWASARDAWDRADGTNKAYNPSEASPGTGGGDYPDSGIDDDRYAAACEMYLTAFALSDQLVATFKDAMTSSPYYRTINQWDWASVYGAGTLSLYAAENDLSAEDKAAIQTNIVAFADNIKQAVDKEGYPSNLNYPSEFNVYPWGSNSFIVNRMVCLAYAYEITGNISYQQYLMRSMDYIMGVNAMDISYVTGYGSKAETDTHDRLAWAVGGDEFWPRGWLSGGPNNELINDYETPSVAAAKSYAGPGTAPHAWCSKENTINWNAPLAWVAWYIENKVVPNLGGCGEQNCQPIADSLTGIKVNMDTASTVVLTASDYDGTVTTWEIVSYPQKGTLSGSAPNLVYQPNTGFIGSDSFQFRVYDDSGNVSKTASVEFVVRDCNFFNTFQVPSSYSSFTGSYNFVHVSEDGPTFDDMRSPAHNVQWANPGLYQFSLEMNVSPYYKDLTQCMTSETLSSSNAGFILSDCGISGLDGEYWITQKNRNEVWVEKNNGWAIVFTNDANYSPEFCRSSGGSTPGPSESPTTPQPVTTNPVDAGSSNPTLPVSPPTNLPTSNLTPPPSTFNPSAKPTLKPTVIPTEVSGAFGCYDRSTGYQTRVEGWCSMQKPNCDACNGKWLNGPIVPNGCCKAWSGQETCPPPDSNPSCYYLKSDCQACSGIWISF